MFKAKNSDTMQQRLERRSIPVPHCGCLIWIGAVCRQGYGSLTYKGLSLSAHRAAWKTSNGDIPEGMFVLHRCDIPACINPDHLFLGSQKDNMADMLRKGRANKPTGMAHGRHTKPWRTARGDNNGSRKQPEKRRGERNGRAKLTEAQVTQIRNSGQTQADLARAFSVTATAIRSVQKFKNWKVEGRT